MPTPKRWFPVSRDINDDPEMWELTSLFGDRALRITLEVFAILDRTENEWRLTGHWLAGLSRKVRQQPATVRRVIDWMLAKGWLIGEQPSDRNSPIVVRARNYWKFHRRREPNGSEAEANQAPSLPNRPVTNLPLPNHRRDEEEGGLLGGEEKKQVRMSVKGEEFSEQSVLQRHPHLADVCTTRRRL